MNVSRPQQNFCSGSMFNNVGGDGITLADLQIVGPANQTVARLNNIVFMKSGATPKTDAARKYWWDPVQKVWRRYIQGGKMADDPTLTVAEAQAILINPGEGVLCNFGSSTTKLTYSGEVLTGTGKMIQISRPQQNFIVVNPSASEINLTQIVISGPSNQTVARLNNIVFMKSGATPKTDAARKYWWDPVQNVWRRYIQGGKMADDPVLTTAEAEAVTIPAGQGFLCNFGSSTTKISMPTSL